MDGQELTQIIGYYCEQGAPQDQQMLIALLREVQEADGGVLSMDALERIAQGCGVKCAVLQALIRRVPSLRSEEAAHRLEICGTCKQGAALRAAVEREYAVTSGAVSKKGGFVYRVTPCMKNCKNGPSVRWDGKLYSCADMALIESLVRG